MNPIFDFFLAPYRSYSTATILIEAIAVFTGLLSVWYAKQNKIGVYPTGMISTGLYVYLLFQAGLLGDLLINAYYFLMSIYGWMYWTQNKEGIVLHPIAQMTTAEKKGSLFLFFGALILVGGLYWTTGYWTSWTAPVDTLTTALFFVGMWLMARRKIAHWLFWIVGDLIAIPLYLYKGLGLTSLQYLIFTVLAFYGYLEWKKRYNKTLQIA